MESVQKPGNQPISSNTTTTHKALIHTPVTSDETISLERNQTIRGLVTDLRPGEISIRLANKQAVTAHLEGNNEVSIGDVASFKILENKDGEITLYKLNTTITPEESTILKALEEANLPANTVNMEIVKELLYHQLPINKESINMVLKQTMQFKNAKVSTLVYMDKHGIPLEEGFIKNFEECRNFNYRLMDHMQSVKEEFLQYMSQVAQREPDTTFLSFVKQLFTFLDIKGAPLPSLEEDFSSIHTDNNSDTLLVLSGKEQSQLLELFSGYDMPEEFIQSIENNTVNIREIVHHITEAMTIAYDTDPTQIEPFKTPLILNIMEQYGSLQLSNDEIASYLTTNERMVLLDAMQDLPLSISDAAAIANGEINSTNLLNLISGYVTPDQLQTLRKLLSAEPFSKIISHQMAGDFTLTPEQLKEDKGVDKFYSSILDKMEQLKKMAVSNKQNADSVLLQNKLDGVKESFDFMKQFNQLFTYVQLPVKLTKQITHGDLYVYTNKEKLKAGTDNISVLLHLDMEHLGPLDIHLALTHKNLQSKFYVQDKDIKNLLMKHEEELKTSLSNIGYTLNMEVYQQTKEVDIIKDLVDHDTKIAPIKRYSFDIRA